MHITGGGFPENIPRIVPKRRDLGFRIRRDAWSVPPLFQWLQQVQHPLHCAGAACASWHMLDWTQCSAADLFLFIHLHGNSDRTVSGYAGGWLDSCCTFDTLVEPHHTGSLAVLYGCLTAVKNATYIWLRV